MATTLKIPKQFAKNIDGQEVFSFEVRNLKDLLHEFADKYRIGDILFDDKKQLQTFFHVIVDKTLVQESSVGELASISVEDKEVEIIVAFAGG